MKVLLIVLAIVPLLGGLSSGVAIVIGIFVDLIRDTTALSNGAFAAASALAFLSFGLAQVMATDHDEDKRDGVGIIRGGELNFLSAFILLMASMIKYAALNPALAGQQDSGQSFQTVFCGISAGAFTVGIILSCIGSVVTYLILWLRIWRIVSR
jgi:hypothetical protein